jgi:hypothetical protein
MKLQASSIKWPFDDENVLDWTVGKGSRIFAGAVYKLFFLKQPLISPACSVISVRLLSCLCCQDFFCINNPPCPLCTSLGLGPGLQEKGGAPNMPNTLH